MTEQEFLDRLSRKLRKYDCREEALGDMREHFMDGKHAGRTESKIAASLGSPEHIAREYILQELAKKSKEKPGFSESILLLWNMLSDRVPEGLAPLIILPAGIILGLALLLLSLFFFSGFGGFLQLLFRPLLSGIELDLSPVSAATLFLGAGFLGFAGLAGLYALVIFLGKKSAEALLADAEHNNI